MNRIHVLAAGAALAFGLGISGSAQATAMFATATLDVLNDGAFTPVPNGLRYETDWLALDGGPVTVNDGDTLTIDIDFVGGRLIMVDLDQPPTERLQWIRLRSTLDTSFGTTGNSGGIVSDVELLGVTGDFDSGELANNHICNITGAAGVVCQAPSGDTWGDITDGAIAFRGMRLTFDPTASSVDVDQVKFRIVADNVDVPEPATLALFGLALVGIGAARRRRRA